MAPSSLLDVLRSRSDPYESLARQREALGRLEQIAEAYLARGEHDDAIATVSGAAGLAELNHPGVQASDRLEAVLGAISAQLPAVDAPAVRGGGSGNAAGQERVLIVATETYESGGHTRMIWRWIGRDPSRSYSVVTTAQRGVMPDGIRRAVADSGGEIAELSADAPPTERAVALRRLACDADLIVLLDHPYDPIPAVALMSQRPRPPIVMFNHGDHLFWIGRGIVDLLMCIRPAGVDFAARRGFPSERVITTPFPVFGPDGHGRRADEPVDPEQRARSRATVLQSLGWPTDTLLLVTVGTHHKWEGPAGHGLLDVIEPVLDAAPHVRLIAAGANDIGRWSELRASTAGRVVPAGVVPNGVGGLLSAADVFLDSRPLGGMAAPAEAAAHGLPVLTGAATEFERSLCAFEDIYGATCVVGDDAYRETLTRLIDDEAMRHELGERARLTLAGADAGWESAVERSFELARSLGPIEQAELGALPEAGDADVLVDWMTTYRGKSPEMLASIVRLRELILANPELRPLYGSLEHGVFRQLARFPAAFAAPGPHDRALCLAVAQLRLLSQFGIAERFVIALTPSDAGSAVPVLEAALAAGPDFDLELTIDPVPARVKPANALVLA